MPSSPGVHLLISGRVQGVGFRFFTRRQALAFELRGYVCNLPDGRVEVVAVGEQSDLESFVEEVQQGPPGSWVRECVADWLDSPGRYADFSIR